ncbi:MAG: DUF4178 domain-containing protein [Pseudomonadota bacterium]
MSALRSLNCTQCGAPLTLLGGHRVESLTCGFCGSVMDAKDDFKVVATFKDLKRPYCPIKIGMRGIVKDVEFTVIGMVQYRDEEYATWVELAMFSPTHGYAWLEYDHGHFIFSRRTREQPEFGGALHHKSPFMAHGVTFRTHSMYGATVTFVEGELTYTAQVGDRVSLTEGIAPPLGFTIERTGSENEYQLSEYLEPADVLEAFGLEADIARNRATVHPIQPYQASWFISGLTLSGMIFGPVAILLLLFTLFFGSGTELLQQSFDPRGIYGKKGVVSHEFEVTDAGNLIGLELYSNLSNAWGAFDVVVRREGKEIFSMGKEISYYSGYEGGESWSEGSREASAYFKVPEPGKYTLQIFGEGGTGSSARRAPQARSLTVTLREGIKVSRYYLVMAVLCLLAWASGFFGRAAFESKRWDDDDDDDDYYDDD